MAHKKTAKKSRTLTSIVTTPLQSIRQKTASAKKINPHRSFRLTNKYNKPTDVKPVASARQLLKESWQLLRAHPKLFVGLFAIYILLYWLLVGGVSQTDYQNLKTTVQDTLGGNVSFITQVGTLFVITSSRIFGQASVGLGQFLLGLLTLIFFLTFVAAARRGAHEKQIRIRDIMYSAPAPLLSSTVVLLVICVQLLPVAIGTFLFTIASGQGFIKGGVEAFVFSAAAFLLGALSLYWIVNSLIGLIIVTLPGAYPLTSLASAKQLTLGRRLRVLLRLLSLALVVIAAWTIIIFPLLLLDNWLDLKAIPFIPLAMQLLSQLSLLFASIYLYRLYRNLL